MKQFFISLLAATISVATIAQTPVTLTVKEESKTMSKGSNNAFVLEVPGTKAAELKKHWGKFLRETSKVKLEEEKSESFVLNTVISRIAPETMNHYVQFSENASSATIIAFFQIGDTFIASNTNAQAAANINALLGEFGKEAFINTVEDEIKAEKKTLKKLDNELEALFKEEDKAKGNIAEYKQKIEQHESEIKVKRQEQDLKQKEIMAQREKMVGISLNKDEKKLQKKLVKGMESEKKKIVKTQYSLRKDISKKESKIRTTEREIEKLKEKQTAKNEEVKKQKDVLQKVEAKLEAVKKL